MLDDLNAPSFFPSDLIDPAEKGKEYCDQFMKAAYSEWKRKSDFWINNRRGDFIVNRKYAEGNQNNLKYKKWVSKLENETGRAVGFMDTDFSIVSTIPKVRDVVLGYLEKIDYRPRVTAVNPEAVAEKEYAEARMKAKMQLKPFFDELQAQGAPPMPGTSEDKFQPTTQEELDLYMSTEFRLPVEIALELGYDITQYANEGKEVDKKMREDAFDLGMFACWIGLNANTNKVEYEYVDPVNLVYQNWRGKYYDGKYIGRVTLKTIAQIKMEAAGQFTEQDYENMAKMATNKYGNPPSTLGWFSDYINTDNQYYYSYDNISLPVFELYWDSIDRIKHTKKETDNGGGYFFKEDYNTKLGTKQVERDGMVFEKSVIATDIPTVYMGKWIIGSEYSYNTGKCKNIGRDSQNKRETFKPIHLYRVANKSILERLIPHADAMQLTWIKIQNAKARAIPKGLSIEITALENISIDGKPVPVKQLLEMYWQSGIIVYRGTATIDDDGYSRGYQPVNELQGGMGAEFIELVNDLNNQINMIREVSGINTMMDSSNPNPKQLVGTATMALEAAENSLYPLISGFIYLKEKTAVDIGSKLQLLSQYGMIEGYANAIGTTEVKYIQINESLSNVKYGIKFERMPTEQEKQNLMVAAEKALTNGLSQLDGGIEFNDYMYIVRMVESGVNLKLVEAVMQKRIKEKKDKDQQFKLQAQQAQAQAQAEAAKAIEEEKRKTMELSTEQAKMLEEWKATQKIRVYQELYPLKIGEQDNQAQHKMNQDIAKNIALSE